MSRKTFARAGRLLAAALLLEAAALSADVMIDSNTFGGLEARSIGPAVMGGRIAAIDAVGPAPLTIYVGAAGGGVWRSKDGGISFRPVFDDHTQSIGAIAIDRPHPDTVWVGTGESWVRNSVSVGTGIYKSTDGGDSWQKVGLDDSEHVAKIIVDPKASDTVYVCATGHLWSSGGDRGVFKTTDGGKTWSNVLAVDADTGCADLDIDPQEPRIIYAGMWQFRRSPYFFNSGGPGSGLYRSTDGGATWKKLEAGLPKGELGRIAIAVAASRPNVVYATVEAKETGLYRSEDLGESWTRVNTSFNIQARPFYFSRLVVDPTDFNYVYKPGLSLAISTDGGKTFNSLFSGGFGGGVHSDLHALWINPQNPQEVLLGTDGGVYQSYDRAHHWRFVKALPVSQFYHVSFDMDWPYNVYGGLQDNGVWSGPSRGPNGVRNQDWKNLYVGDGFYAYRDPSDRDYAYAEYQGGQLARIRISTGEVRDIKPYPAKGEPDLRFNWNTPIALSPNHPGTVYVGAQYLFRSTDKGDSWERISPDLTTNDPKKQRQAQSGGLTTDNSSAENYTTLFTICESPKNDQVIWVGTDDGNLQVTRDGGKSWSNVAGNVPGLPQGTWVSTVEAGHYAEGTAYATFDGHRGGDMKTYVYRTTDFGATWTALATPAIEGYAHVVREDLERPDLLFVGTERGLYVSVDGGKQWARFTGNLPKVAVDDIAIHPRESDLILATHGRGVYILDDITPLRQLTSQLLDSDVAVLSSRPAVLVTSAGGFSFGGDDEFVGANPPEAASVVYYLKKRHLFGDLKVEVYDAAGKLLTTLPGPKRVGLNRVDWPMRLPPPKLPPATALVPAFEGPRLPEGTYKVRLVKATSTYDGQVELIGDPRSPHSAEDRALQQKTALQLYDLLARLTYIVETTSDVHDQATARAAGLKTGDRLKKGLDDLAGRLEPFRQSLVATSEAGWLSGEEKLREKLGNLYGAVEGFDGKPTQSQLDRMGILTHDLDQAEARFTALTGKEVEAANRELAGRKLEPIKVLTREEWDKKQKS